MKSLELFPNLTERSNFYNLEGAAEQGILLPSVSALALEEALALNEFDLITRARLLGFYCNKIRLTKAQQICRVRHIAWFIENIPASKFAGDIYLGESKTKHPEFYDSIKELWTKQIERQPQSVQIKINAAMFSFFEEQSYSINLLKTVAKEFPNNLWTTKLLAKLKLNNDLVYDYEKAPNPFLELDNYRQYADKVFLETVFSHGGKMPADAALTLEQVVAKFPDDMNARAELMGHYSERFKRANVIGVDPESLDRFMRHLLWCVEFIPGSNFLSGYPGISTIVHDLPENELEQVKKAWDQKIKIRQARYSISIKTWKKKILTPDLEDIATDTGVTLAKRPPDAYQYVDWATEVDLGSAQLEGVYHWVPKKSISNLDSILDNRRSTDIYSRAKIIGFYDAYFSHAESYKKSVSEMGLTKQARDSYAEHMLWFIENMPECQFVSMFYLSSVKKHDSDLYKVLKLALLTQAKLHTKNLKIQVNVAAAFTQSDERITRKLSKVISALDKSWAATVLALLGDALPDVDVKLELKQHSFVAGQRNSKFSKIAKRMDLLRHSLFGWSMTRHSAWSSEVALERNPNDLVLRAELLEAYNAFDRYNVTFHGHTPDVVPDLIRHNLWFIQNLPNYYMYSRGCEIAHHGYRKTDRYLGPHAILLEAAKRQTKEQPASLSVGLSMNHYYPLGYEKQSIAALRKLRQLFPNNKELNGRLEHLRGLERMRTTARKQFAAKKSK